MLTSLDLSDVDCNAFKVLSSAVMRLHDADVYELPVIYNLPNDTAMQLM